MFYKYDKQQLTFTKNRRGLYLVIAIAVALATGSYLIGRFRSIQSLSNMEKELIVLNLQQERNKFTEEKLIQLLKDLNVRYPHIALAQAKLETGNFKSAVFKQNHNLFGMKQARVRVNTAKGTNLNHAYYDNWQESVYDYAFYQCRYMGGATTEAEYFAALDASYAEASQYSQVLKQKIKQENLKSLF